MKRVLLIFLLSIGCLFVKAQAVYKIISEAKHSRTERPADEDFKPSSSSYIVVQGTKIDFYDTKRNKLASMECPTLDTKSLEDLFILTGKGFLGKEPVNFVFNLRDEVMEAHVLRITFPLTNKGVTFLLLDM